MDLSDFEVLVALAETGSVTRAAERLGRTQPAVSVRLRKLAEELGVPLVQMSGKGVRFTDAGEALVVEARRVLAAVAVARDAVQSVRGLLSGRVVVGASTTPGSYLLPELLTRFRREHPKVEVALRVGNSLAIERAILAGEADLGVVGGHLESRDVDARAVHKDRLVVFAAVGHPLAEKRRVTLEDLAAQPFVLREPGSATRALVQHEFARHRLSVQVALEVGSPDALKRAVAAGAGLGVLSRLALCWEIEDSRLAVLAVKDLALERELLLVTRKGREPSAAARVLISELERLPPDPCP